MNRTPHDLLTLAADEIDVPVPDLAALKHEGRRLRRGRTLRWAAPAAGVAAASVAAAAFLLPSPDRDPQIEVAQVAAAAFDAEQTARVERALTETGAFSIGTTLYLGSADPTPISLEVPAIRGLYPTSAGVLVRHGKNRAMDVASRYSLVAPDGSVSAIDLEPGDVMVGTDPTQPYFAYAVGQRGSWTVLVIDLRSGEKAGAVEIEGDFTWGGWDAPPVSLSGDEVHVALNEKTVTSNWRTGQQRVSAVPGSEAPAVRGGRQVLRTTTEAGLVSELRVIDAGTGEPMLTVKVDPDEPTLGILSPDGSTLMVGPYLLVGEDGVVRNTADTRIIDVATGKELDLPTSTIGGFGWTPSGRVFSVDGKQSTVCDAVVQRCTTQDLDLGLTASDVDGIKLAGLVTDS